MATIQEAFAAGISFRQAGQLDAAEQVFRRIVEVEAAFAPAWQLLGACALESGRPEEAVQCLERALALHPASHEAQFELGVAFQAQGKLDEAIASFRQTLELKPDCAEAQNNIGSVLLSQEKFEEAAAAFRLALTLKPDTAGTYGNLGSALAQQGNRDEAIVCFRKALELDPSHAGAHYNLGTDFFQQGQWDEAAACYRSAVALRPGYAEAHWNLALVTLLQGDFETGWSQYEWRWKSAKRPPRNFAQPQWKGEALQGRTILLHAEQGLGDTIQFIRYAPMVKSLGATVFVECQRPLMKLLASCKGIDRLIAAGDELPAFDVHSPFLSLPAIFKTTLSTVPATVPYVFPDNALVAEWNARLGAIPGFRIGINWHGRENMLESRKQDIPLESIASLCETPGVRLISLQKGAGQEELKAACDKFPIVDWGEFDVAHGAFMDTAAIMKRLELVVTSDTSVAHLAGAFGVPVWVALPLAPDWRWMLDRDDSPWYPTMRLFRQKRAGDWAGVFEEIGGALRGLVAGKK